MNLLKYNSHQRRYHLTLDFISHRIDKNKKILDLGASNTFSDLLKKKGYNIKNTDFDFDREPEKVSYYDVEICTAFEIFEHLLNPLSVLQHLPGHRLFASVPLQLWFSSAYRNKSDPWDCHFHEFEDWQFDWLLDHAGWKVIRREKWKNPAIKLGIRPILRLFTPRWYIVEAIKEDTKP